ncbi:ATP-dependent Clp protease proteolytic subunit, partial [Nocardia cyriacigeorgica]
RYTVETVLGLIAADTGQPYERIYEDSLHDRWFTATQAKEYGFIDHIVESFGQVVPQRQKIGISA